MVSDCFYPGFFAMEGGVKPSVSSSFHSPAFIEAATSPISVAPIPELIMTGAVYDASAGLMYVTENFSDKPAVHVYQIALSNTSIDKKNAPITDVSNLAVKAYPMGGGIRFDIHSESITHHLNGHVLDLQGKSLTKLILTAESPTHFTSYWNGVDGKNGASGGSFILSIHSGDRQVYLKLFQIN